MTLLILLTQWDAYAMGCFKRTETMSPDEEAAMQLARRIIPKGSKSIDFVQLPSDEDFFSLETVDGRLRICGNNANSMAVGLNAYLKEYCHRTVTWFLRDRIADSRKLPAVPTKVKRKALVGKRFFLNYCTYGYTLNWWQWEDWEHLIDWMALNGVTLALATTGQEAVWQEVWRGFGLSDEQIRAYFPGPSYLSWHRMTNIDSWHSPLPQSWIDGQKELQRKIIARELSLGISPILSSFTGHVPKALKEKFPDADITKLGAWSGFTEPYHTWYLNASDPLYKRIQKAYFEKQREIYGQDCHIYGVDLFNEVDPPSWEPEYLAEAARSTYEAMAETDPEAVWLQMSWMFYSDRDKWTPECIEAYVSPVPKGRLIMLDYYCDRMEIYRNTRNFYGQDFIWSYLGNFGGSTMIVGDIKDISMKLDRVFTDAPESCVGVGCTLEGLDVNPQMYEYVLGRAWGKEMDDAMWFRELADRHLGHEDEAFRQCWDIMYEKVHRQYSHHIGSMIPTRPNLRGFTSWNHPQTTYDNADLLEAWECLTKVRKPSATPSFRFDCVNMARQCLDNWFGDLYNDVIDAYKAKDAARIKECGDQMLEILDDVDRLVASDSYYLLGEWIRMAREWGVDEAEKQYFEEDAKNIISTWGFEGAKLTDYANRVWNGLVSTYYSPRWKRFLDALVAAIEAGEEFDQQAFNDQSAPIEWAWISDGRHFDSKPSGNPFKLSCALYDKYGDRISAYYSK